MSEDKVLNDTEEQLLKAMGLDENGAMKQDYIAYAGKKLDSKTIDVARDDIIDALKTVSDPEIMINIWDMGLIYRIEQKENGDVDIDMTVTAPTCPVAGVLPQQAADAVSAIDGIGLVTVKVVWEPAWTIENMSDEARAMFEFF